MARLRVHLLGRLEVVRPDHSRVEPREWRTGKTMDLLRILALAEGRPVRSDLLVDRLWPGTPPERARASLRTAASQVRRTAGVSCVVRQPDGLALVGAWVDVAAFRRLCRQAQQHAEGGQPDAVLTAAATARELWVGELRAHDDDSDWAQAERDVLGELRRRLLCQATEAALATERPQLAVELAAEATRAAPSSERAHRSLMLAHEATGEVGSALVVYEQLRRYLAEELGADPSPPTRELHLRLLHLGLADDLVAPSR